MAASRNTWQSIQRLPKTNHDSLQSRLAGILAAFFLYLYSTCIKFSKYIISALTFYLQAAVIAAGEGLFSQNGKKVCP
jgi:hypothetical protein